MVVVVVVGCGRCYFHHSYLCYKLSTWVNCENGGVEESRLRHTGIEQVGVIAARRWCSNPEQLINLYNMAGDQKMH